LLQEPDDTNAIENDSVSFFRTAWGELEPDIHWDFNGAPITLNQRLNVTHSSLVLINVTKDDSGSYGCNASNIMGFIYKSVLLNVFGK
jgi:hypothetical protein